MLRLACLMAYLLLAGEAASIAFLFGVAITRAEQIAEQDDLALRLVLAKSEASYWNGVATTQHDMAQAAICRSIRGKCP